MASDGLRPFGQALAAFSTLTCAISLLGFIALKLQLEIVGFDASIRDNQLVLKAFFCELGELIEVAFAGDKSCGMHFSNCFSPSPEPEAAFG